MTLSGLNQTPTATLPLHVTDTTGAGVGWRVSASATPWTGGSFGLLLANQRVGTPPAPTCDAGVGTCTLATPTALAWPITLSSTPAVIYNATAGTGTGAQTVSMPMSLPLTASLAAWGSFSQEVTLTVAAGP